jgi:hypothetical protein
MYFSHSGSHIDQSGRRARCAIKEGAATSASQTDKKPVPVVNLPLDASDEALQSAHAGLFRHEIVVVEGATVNDKCRLLSALFWASPKPLVKIELNAAKTPMPQMTTLPRTKWKASSLLSDADHSGGPVSRVLWIY